MFAKKQRPPEPKLPEPPPILQISTPEELAAIIAEAERKLEPGPTEKEFNDRLAHGLITQAFHDGAEQMSLTPDTKALEAQYLIAGEWQTVIRFPIRKASGLGIAFKALAGLPAWEHRMALEGLIVARCGEVDYDVYVSITPTRYGEKITMRIEVVPQG